MKYKEIILPLVENYNIKIFKTANILRLIGIVSLILTVFFLDYNTIRIVSVSICLILISLPFILRFFIDAYIVVGAIKFTGNEIVIKLKNQEPILFDIKNVSNLQYKILDYEGETKLTDFANSAGQLKMRSGTDNIVSFFFDNEIHIYKFKIDSEIKKKESKVFFKVVLNKSVFKTKQTTQLPNYNQTKLNQQSLLPISQVIISN